MGGRHVRRGQVRLRRDATVRSVSTSALLEAASPLDEPEDGHGAHGDPFALPTVVLAALTVKQRREVERQVEERAPGPSWRPTVLVVDS